MGTTLRCLVDGKPAHAVLPGLDSLRLEKSLIARQLSLAVQVVTHHRQPIRRLPIHGGIEIGPVVAGRQLQSHFVADISERDGSRWLGERC